ncbi:MAG: GAF domain-containing protein [Asticcacaulis sp.]|uniref:GAF domain-containing protein n=1 Tax=Asticcacaulis sp. TaxID=1872648 RepID=UPI003F7CBF49
MTNYPTDRNAARLAPGLPELDDSLYEILDASIEITQADFGNIQIVNASGDALLLAAQRGFAQAFVEHFAVVPLNDASSVCGRAAQSHQRLKVVDVEADERFAPHRKIARDASIRAFQSTPLLSRNGQLLGMLSTHFRLPRLPDEQHLHMLDLYAAQAAHVLELMRARDPVSAPAAASPNPLSLRLLKDLPFFAELTDEERDELSRVAQLRHYRSGDAIYRAGDVMTHYFWVCVGAVQKSRLTPEGREFTAAIRIAGDILLEHDASRTPRVRTLNARAVGATTLLAVPAAWIEQRFSQWDHLSNKVLELLTRRVQDARIEVEHQASFNATQIAACFLQQLCVSHRLDPAGFPLPYSKQLIASRLGMEQESLSRIFPRLRDHGVRIEGRKAVFTDLEAAQAYACDACTVSEDCAVRRTMQRLVAPQDAARKA